MEYPGAGVLAVVQEAEAVPGRGVSLIFDRVWAWSCLDRRAAHGSAEDGGLGGTVPCIAAFVTDIGGGKWRVYCIFTSQEKRGKIGCCPLFGQE